MKSVLRRSWMLGAAVAALFADQAMALAPAKPDLPTLDGRAPIVIAHRGASGYRPEHTRSAYLLAIAQGADFIEPDLVMTKDGHMVIRHENEISGTTDVAKHPEFAARKTTKTIDGQSVTGWFTEDFTLAELKTLRAVERLGQYRTESAKFDGQDQILTFAEIAEIAKSESRRTGRTIGVYPELKHVHYFNGLGFDSVAQLAKELREQGWAGADAPVYIQCFEVEPLKRIAKLVKTPRIFLIEGTKGPVDVPGRSYQTYATAEGLKEVATFANGIGPDLAMVLPRDASGAISTPSDLVQNAHAAGLKVHPWTFRAENAFLPTNFKSSAAPDAIAKYGDLRAYMKAAVAAGIDGAFSDFPDVATEVFKAKK